MLTVQQFIENILEDFKRDFAEVELEEKFIRLGTGVTHVELPIESLYKEYQVIGYDKTIKLYIKAANQILNQYKFKINYNNVYPMLFLYLRHIIFIKCDINNLNSTPIHINQAKLPRKTLFYSGTTLFYSEQVYFSWNDFLTYGRTLFSQQDHEQRKRVNKVFPFCKKTPSKTAENRVFEQHYFHFGTT